MFTLPTLIPTSVTIFALILPPISLLAPKGVVPLLMIAAIVVGTACWRRDGRLPAPDRTIALLLGLLLVWAGITSFWTFVPERAFVLVLRLAALFAAGLVLLSVATTLDGDVRWRIGNYLLIGMGGVCLVLLMELVLDFPLLEWLKGPLGQGEHRLQSLNRGVSTLALMIWPVTAILWRRGLGAAALGAPVALNVLLFFFASAAALVALAGGLVTAGAALIDRRAGQALAVLAIVGLVAGSPFVAKQIYALGWFEANWLPLSAQGRVIIWNYTADRIFEKPLLGWGFDASRNMPPIYDPALGSSKKIIPLHPHNAGLQVLLELGVVGAALVLALLVTVKRRLERLPGGSRILAQGQFITTLAIASTAYGLWQNQWIATMLATAILSAICFTEAPDEDATIGVAVDVGAKTTARAGAGPPGPDQTRN